MPWFKVDDNLGFHHKVIAAGNAAMGLWVRAGAVSANQLTDGFVPDRMVSALGNKQQAERLVAVGLWVRTDGGYLFHEWSERQPSRMQVEADREAARKRMAERRRNKGGGFAGSSGDVRANFAGSSEGVRPPRPDPTRPEVPNGTTEGADKPPSARQRAARCPADFEPNDANRRVAAEHQVDLDRVLPQFLDHHRSKGSTYVDWHLALNTWIRRERPAAPANSNNVVQLPDGRTKLPPMPPTTPWGPA